MKGFAIKDDDVLEEMTGNSEIVMGGRVLNNGAISFGNAKMLKTSEEFLDLKNDVFDNIKQTASKIAKGEYPVKPYDISKDNCPCKYCKMRSICGICINIQEKN